MTQLELLDAVVDQRKDALRKAEDARKALEKIAR